MKQLQKFTKHSQNIAGLYCESYQNSTVVNHQFVLLHGLGGDANATITTIKAILQKIPQAQCITYDLRGHGKSTRSFPQKAQSIEAAGAIDLQQICQTLKLKQPVFIGHSLGTLIIQDYLVKQLLPQPQNCILLNAVTTTPPISLNRKLWFNIRKKLNQWFAQNQSSKKRSLKQHTQHQNTFDFNIKRTILDYYYTGFLNLLLMYLATFGWQNPQLSVLNTSQVIYVYGSKDLLICKKTQEKILKQLPQAKAVCLNCNHHQAFLTHSQTVARLAHQTV
ncbi:MAG: alpha/beta fold hydrolase [Candidatus Pacebacteria bacterium]|nr:alpha/beta fold hydrolase [Candidatus Paceibacterota bacterium]